jgi:hypothetical protein
VTRTLAAGVLRLEGRLGDRASAAQSLCGRDRIRTCVGNAGDFTGRTAVSPRVPSHPHVVPLIGRDQRKRREGGFSRQPASPPVPPRPVQPNVGRSENGANSRPPAPRFRACRGAATGGAPRGAQRRQLDLAVRPIPAPLAERGRSRSARWRKCVTRPTGRATSSTARSSFPSSSSTTTRPLGLSIACAAGRVAANRLGRRYSGGSTLTAQAGRSTPPVRASSQARLHHSSEAGPWRRAALRPEHQADRREGW